MKFGQTAAAARIRGWRYIDYDALKAHIKSGIEVAAFRLLLHSEVAATDACFRERRAKLGCTEEVRAHAVLNYLTLLKICKKAAKRLDSAVSEWPCHLTDAAFCQALLDPTLLAERATPCADDGEHGWRCPICLQSDPVPSRLGCRHSFCAPCLSQCARAGMTCCPLCREEQTLDPISATIEEVLSPKEAYKYKPSLRLSPMSTPVPDAYSDTATGQVIKVLTFNVAAICFPLHAHPSIVLLGVLLLQDWSDPFSDVPLDAGGARAAARWAQQAEYIRSSRADVVLLQEVSSTATVRALLSHLGDSYTAHYARRAPSAVGLSLWVLAHLLLAAMQLVLLEGIAMPLLHPSVVALSGGLLGRYVLVMLVGMLRWRHSCVTQYLMGDVGGQLVTLCSTSSSAFDADAPCVVGFEPFNRLHTFERFAGQAGAPRPPHRRRQIVDEPFVFSSQAAERASRARRRTVLDHWRAEDGDHAAPAAAARSGRNDERSCTPGLEELSTPGLLEVFFSLTPRGLLRTRLPLRRGAGQVTIMNTHLPHLTDNKRLLEAIASQIGNAGRRGAVIFGGDLNTLPSPDASVQLAPLLQADCKLPGASGQPCNTWDLSQPLTRVTCETSRTMQLDYLLTRSQGDVSARHRRHMPSKLAVIDESRRTRQVSTRQTTFHEVSHAQLHRPEACFTPGAPLSDHTGLLLTVMITHERDDE